MVLKYDRGPVKHKMLMKPLAEASRQYKRGKIQRDVTCMFQRM